MQNDEIKKNKRKLRKKKTKSTQVNSTNLPLAIWDQNKTKGSMTNNLTSNDEIIKKIIC
jgi:hypothetical protein